MASYKNSRHWCEKKSIEIEESTGYADSDVKEIIWLSKE